MRFEWGGQVRLTQARVEGREACIGDAAGCLRRIVEEAVAVRGDVEGAERSHPQRFDGRGVVGCQVECWGGGVSWLCDSKMVLGRGGREIARLLLRVGI
jgi:hypothetical protein